MFSQDIKNVEWHNLLKGIRIVNGLTQDELGRKLDLRRTQLLRYENSVIPGNRIRRKILNYIHNNNLDMANLYKTNLQAGYLDKNYLWVKLVYGLQTVNGWSNIEIAKLLGVDKKSVECWKVKRINPNIKVKSKILSLVGDADIQLLINYSGTNWVDYLCEIKNRLPVSDTLLAKLLGVSGSHIRGLSQNWKPKFRLRKELITLMDLIKKNKDIRDVIFTKRKQRFLNNRYLLFRYLRLELNLSQEELAKSMLISQDLYARFELGQQNLIREKKNLVEKRFKMVAKRDNIDYNKLKDSCIKQIDNSEMYEIRQWNLRKNIHEIIGFRMPHKKEKFYFHEISTLLHNNGFVTFQNVILADKKLQTFVLDLFAFKKTKTKNITLCFEIRNRCNLRSANITFLHNINRLEKIRKHFNFNYAIFISPHFSKEKKHNSYCNIILLDNEDLNTLKSGAPLLKFLKNKELPTIFEIRTFADFKQYLKQNKLTLRDMASVTSLSFSYLRHLGGDRDIDSNKSELKKFIRIVETKGIAYVKFQRYKKIYTNQNFLKLKAIRLFLRLTEKEFQFHFGVKPSTFTDKCLNSTCIIPSQLLSAIKLYVIRHNLYWTDILTYSEDYIKKELRKWEQLEQYNIQIGWKFIKFLGNTNALSEMLENEVSIFLSQRYRNLLRNVQIYLPQTNQVREIDIVSFNMNKDILITECKLSTPAYGSKILFQDLDTIKNAIGAQYAWLVTPQTNLQKEFSQIIESSNGSKK